MFPEIPESELYLQHLPFTTFFFTIQAENVNYHLVEDDTYFHLFLQVKVPATTNYLPQADTVGIIIFKFHNSPAMCMNYCI